MKKSLAARIGVALAGGAVLATAAPAMAAVTVKSPAAGVRVHIDSQDKISARGAAVTVKVQVTCPADQYGSYLQVAVNERVGHTLTSGAGYVNVQCTGNQATIPVYVQASNKPFAVGSASIAASLQTGYGYPSVFNAFGTVKFVK